MCHLISGRMAFARMDTSNVRAFTVALTVVVAAE